MAPFFISVSIMSSTSSIKPGAPSAHYSARAMAERSMAIAPSITDVIEAVGPDFDDSSGEFDPTDIDLQSEAWQSIDSSVYRHHYENGRRYHKYRYGRYPIPNDDQEQNRDDWKHAMHMELTEYCTLFRRISGPSQLTLMQRQDLLCTSRRLPAKDC